MVFKAEPNAKAFSKRAADSWLLTLAGVAQKLAAKAFEWALIPVIEQCVCVCTKCRLDSSARWLGVVRRSSRASVVGRGCLDCSAATSLRHQTRVPVVREVVV